MVSTPGYKSMGPGSNPIWDFCLDTAITLRHCVEQYRLDEPQSLELSLRAFGKSALRLYNKLLDDVKNISNLAIFKKRLMTHLLTESYDTENTHKIVNFLC